MAQVRMMSEAGMARLAFDRMVATGDENAVAVDVRALRNLSGYTVVATYMDGARIREARLATVATRAEADAAAMRVEIAAFCTLPRQAREAREAAAV